MLLGVMLLRETPRGAPPGLPRYHTPLAKRESNREQESGLRLLRDVIAKFLLQPGRYGNYGRNPVWLCGLYSGHLSKPAYLPGVRRFLCQTAYAENDERCEQE